MYGSGINIYCFSVWGLFFGLALFVWWGFG
jgi:hypothetical protein